MLQRNGDRAGSPGSYFGDQSERDCCLLQTSRWYPKLAFRSGTFRSEKNNAEGELMEQLQL